MSKRFKVIRSRGRIYDPIKGKIIKASLILVGAAVLFLLGWMVYEPIFDALTANKSSSESQPESVVSASESEPEPEPEPTMLDGSVRAAFVPGEIFADDELWAEFLQMVKNAGLNAVMFDLKDEDGVVTYISEQESVEAADSAAEQPVDIASRLADMKAEGINSIARIYAFQDGTASANLPEMAIRYMEADGVVWLDDAQEQGGRAWLNPYSEMAQKYVLDVIYDAISFGCDSVLMAGVRFPEDYGIRFAYFGERSAVMERREALQEFMEKASAACARRDVQLILGYSGTSVFTEDTKIYGGSPAVLTANGYSPSFLPSDIVDMDGLPKSLTYAALPDDLAVVAGAMVEALNLATDAKQIPMVQAYELGAMDITAMTEGLLTAGVDSYILYDPESTEYLEDLGRLMAGEELPEEISESSVESSSESSDSSDGSESSESSESAESSVSSESSAADTVTSSAVSEEDQPAYPEEDEVVDNEAVE